MNHYPEYIRNTIKFRDFSSCAPSELYGELLATKKNRRGNNLFHYLGKVSIFPGKEGKYIPPKLHPLIRDFSLEHFPELFEDGQLKDCAYGMTYNTARGEYNSTSKYGEDLPTMRWRSRKRATIMLSDCFAQMERQPILDLDSSILWLEKQTSPGYPWRNVYRTKAEVLGSDYWRAWYVWWERQIFSGMMFISFWRAFIKKEWKKLTAIFSFEPRTILASPIELTVLGNRLFGCQNSYIAQLGSHFRIPCWVGSTKYNLNWDRMTRELSRFPNMNDSDAKHFDGNVRKSAFLSIKQVRMSWFKKPALVKKAVEYFYVQVCHTILIGWHGDVFSKAHGQPSGQINTLVDNSLIHLLYWFYFWCEFVCKNLADLEPTWASFKAHVCIFVQGDDAIYSYSDYVKKFFAAPFLRAAFLKFGVILKHNHDEPQGFDTLEFCSMGFLKAEGHYFPTPKRSKMLASIFYIKNMAINANNPRVLLRRLISLRIEIFWDKKLFNILEELILYILKEYDALLRQQPTGRDGDDMSYQQILDTMLGVEAIRLHYISLGL